MPPAVLVAIAHTSCGMGMRMKLPLVVVRMAGLAKVPVYENEPVVVLSVIWIASASPIDQLHISRGARRPRGHTVLS